jgi:glycosyltransferase 2 family protein
VNRLSRHLLTILRTALGFALLYWVLALSGGWASAKHFVSTVWILPALGGFTLFGAAIESKRLGLLFEAQGIRVSFAHGYRLVAIGTLFNFAIPGGTGGDVVKLYYLTSENRGRGVEVATILLVDRMVALFSMLSLVVGLGLVEGKLVRDLPLVRWLVAVSILSMMGLLLVAVTSSSARVRISSLYAYIITKMPLHHYLKRILDALYTYREHKTTLLMAALYSLFAHLVLVSLFMFVGTVLLPDVPSLITGFLAMLALMANALPITPGGLGVGEAVSEGLFATAGFAGGAQLILAWRIGMLALCLMGALFYVSGKAAGQRAGGISLRRIPAKG